MIRKITLCEKHKSRTKRKFKQAEYRFDSRYNVVIGPNQSGKSTLLEALATCEYCDIEKDSQTKIKFFSTETLNPLGTRRFSSYSQMIMHSRALFSSHGEIVREVLGSQRYDGENCFIIDTPETGQDIEQCYSLHKGLKKIVEKHKIQIIVATHHPVFLRNANKIIEFEKNYKNKLISLFQESLRIE